MPELPEVETIVRNLKEKLGGKIIRAVKINSSRSLNVPPAVFKKKISRAKIVQVRRVGKYIIIHLIKGKVFYLVVHLRMSGQFIIAAGLKEKVRIGFYLKNCWLNFLDARNFARIWLVNDWKKTPAGRIGPDALKITRKEFLERFSIFARRFPKKMVKVLLLEQEFISGIGNIYAAEILFLSRINPKRKIGSLTSIEQKNIFLAMKKILRKAIARRGTSFDYAYRDTRGRPGDFQRYLNVYGRAQEQCRRCGRNLVSEKIVGRTTVWCRRCQN